MALQIQPRGRLARGVEKYRNMYFVGATKRQPEFNGRREHHGDNLQQTAVRGQQGRGVGHQAPLGNRHVTGHEELSFRWSLVQYNLVYAILHDGDIPVEYRLTWACFPKRALLLV